MIFSFLITVFAFASDLQFGVERIDQYASLVQGKRIGLVVNQGSTRGGVHTIDRLLKQKLKIQKLFALEHGVRGQNDAGEDVGSGVDPETGIPIESLYGENKKPSSAMLKNLDVLVFDVQDIGVRLFTFISSLGYLLEAAAENQIPIVVFDRPNPHASIVDGPVLKKDCQSFVGLYPIPLLYGLTIGELAQMIHGEHWRNTNGLKLTVIELKNYHRSETVELETNPSPNLRSSVAIRLYPSLVFFEPTEISVGRGTPAPFTIFGAPLSGLGTYTFTPEPGPGAKEPLHEDELCYGENLGEIPIAKLPAFTFQYFSETLAKWKKLTDKKFVLDSRMLELLVGDKAIVSALLTGANDRELRQKIAPELDKFRERRKSYLRYPD